jgi:uncharacterized repeat protein (TIGR03987 family)
MFFSVMCIIFALILYTTAIWSEKFTGNLKVWMVVIFSSGFLCDLVGTTIMRLRAAKNSLNFHSACGYAALIIMCLHLIWAFLAITKHGKAEELFSRFSVYAWIIWLIAFFSGIPKK